MNDNEIRIKLKSLLELGVTTHFSTSPFSFTLLNENLTEGQIETLETLLDIWSQTNDSIGHPCQYILNHNGLSLQLYRNYDDEIPAHSLGVREWATEWLKRI